MEEYVSKEEVIEELSLVYSKEEIEIIFAYHKDHPIIKDPDGRFRWEHQLEWERDTENSPNNVIEKYINGEMTQEEYMDYNRKIGYSLYGYWEVFVFNDRFNEKQYAIDMAKQRGDVIDEVLK